MPVATVGDTDRDSIYPRRVRVDLGRDVTSLPLRDSADRADLVRPGALTPMSPRAAVPRRRGPCI